MTKSKYIASIEALIAEQQDIQKVHPVDSYWWAQASEEIHRLSTLIVETQKGS